MHLHSRSFKNRDGWDRLELQLPSFRCGAQHPNTASVRKSETGRIAATMFHREARTCVRVFLFEAGVCPQAGSELSRIASYYPVKRVPHADRNLLIITTCYTKIGKKIKR